MAARNASYKQELQALHVGHSPHTLPSHSKTLNKPAVGPVVFPYPSTKPLGEILAGTRSELRFVWCFVLAQSFGWVDCPVEKIGRIWWEKRWILGVDVRGVGR